MADDDHPIANASIDDQEESVRIAIKALGDMRSGARADPNPRTLPPLSISSSSTSSVKSPRIASPTSLDTSRDRDVSEASSSAPAFVSRMSSLPLLGSAMRVYEQGKASSRVVKYGAEMMESSVKAVSRPVIDRLPVNVNQLDDFACRQLDRLDRYRRPSTGADTTTSPSATMAISPTSPSSTYNTGRPKLKTKTLDGSAIEDDEDINEGTSSYSGRRWKGSDRGVPSWLEESMAPPPDSRSSTPTRIDEDGNANHTRNISSSDTAGGTERQVAQRSRWQAVLLEAGGLSAALSEESMRKLKYCLQWLQYATAHIDAQILILRDFTASLQPLPSSSSSVTRRPPISEDHLRKLTAVRRDIVHTIRQVVDVVSKYTGGALPEPARTRVRGFILKLPQRWATKAGPVATGASASSSASAVASLSALGERETVAAAGGLGTSALRRPGGPGQRRAAQRERGMGAPEPGMRSGTSSRAQSPSSSPRMARASLASTRHGDAGQGGDAVSASAALVASQRILVLATESLDMMRNVTGVVKDSLDRADAWVGRLRTVGIQRGAHEGEDIPEHDIATEFGFPRPEHTRHRRAGSATSTAFSDLDAEHDADRDPDIPSSPFFSSNASMTWGSSIPSTPGGGTYTPGGGGFGSAAGGYNAVNEGASYEKSYASYAGAPSPGAIPIGAMSLASRYNTPRSVVAGLPEEEEEAEGDEGDKSGSVIVREVRVVDGAEEDGEERGVQKMEVDV
ncbi:transcription factor Opi1-domain-containing protein [Pholiota molesta]|nr:transcription factor Opi1-domain-containing protein [Pholiota molesta]